MIIVTNPMAADWIIQATVDNPSWKKLYKPELADPREKKHFLMDLSTFCHMILTLCVITTPAIGHFVVVGQMLSEYGSCSQLQKLGL
jgi:hypothetical protein